LSPERLRERMSELLRHLVRPGAAHGSESATPELDQQFEQIGRNPDSNHPEGEN
jgi:hypothetical protein